AKLRAFPSHVHLLSALHHIALGRLVIFPTGVRWPPVHCAPPIEIRRSSLPPASAIPVRGRATGWPCSPLPIARPERVLAPSTPISGSPVPGFRILFVRWRNLAGENA